MHFHVPGWTSFAREVVFAEVVASIHASGAVVMDAPGGQPSDGDDDDFADFAAPAKPDKGQDAAALGT